MLSLVEPQGTGLTLFQNRHRYLHRGHGRQARAALEHRRFSLKASGIQHFLAGQRFMQGLQKRLTGLLPLEFPALKGLQLTPATGK